MIQLAEILPIILYIFGIILMIVLIILGIRLLRMLDKIDRVLDNVEEKVNSFNGLFNVIERTSTSIDLISNKIVNGVVGAIGKVFKNKNREDNDE